MKIKEFLNEGFGYLLSLVFWCTIAFVWGCTKGEDNEKDRHIKERNELSHKCDSLTKELKSARCSSAAEFGKVRFSKYLYIDSGGVTHKALDCYRMYKRKDKFQFVVRVPIEEATVKNIYRCCRNCITDEVYDSLKTYITGEKLDLNKKMPHLTALFKERKKKKLGLY